MEYLFVCIWLPQAVKSAEPIGNDPLVQRKMADLSVFTKPCEILSLNKHQPKQHYIYDKTLAARIVCVLSAGAITLKGLNWKTACDGSWLTTNTRGVGRVAADVGRRCCISRQVSGCSRLHKSDLVDQNSDVEDS